MTIGSAVLEMLCSKKKEIKIKGWHNISRAFLAMLSGTRLITFYYLNDSSGGGFCSLICLRDELLVSTGRGLLQRLRWSDGLLNTEMTIEVASIPFSADLQHSRCAFFFLRYYYVSLSLNFSLCSTVNNYRTHHQDANVP